jgi:hypothetical protein
MLQLYLINLIVYEYQTGTVDHPQHHLWNQLGIIRNALVFSF